jgi:hypothetical protein
MKIFRIICLVLALMGLIVLCLILFMATWEQSQLQQSVRNVVIGITGGGVGTLLVALISLGVFIFGLVVWFLTGIQGLSAKRIQASSEATS